MISVNGLRLQHIIGLIALVIMGACAPAPSETVGGLPTLARLPSETATAPADTSPERLTLPASFTPTFTPTLTATNDPSITPTLTFTPSVTASATITNTPTATPTELPTLDPAIRPLLGIVELARQATVLPSDYSVPAFGGPEFTPVAPSTELPPGVPSPIPPVGATTVGNTGTLPTCTTSTSGGFLTLYQNNTGVASQLGCPSGAVQSVPAAWQNFQGGIMVWLNGEIIVFYSDTNNYELFADTYVDGVDPETTSEVPPAGFNAPIRGFLKVWSNNSTVRDRLGWGTTGENGTTASVQIFASGRMIFLPGRGDVLVIFGTSGSSWQSLIGAY